MSILSNDDPFGIGSLFSETCGSQDKVAINKATVRPFKSGMNIPAPPSLDDIASSQVLRNDDDISASQLIANSRFKAPKGILKRKSDDTIHPQQKTTYLPNADSHLLDLGLTSMSQDPRRPLSHQEVNDELPSMSQNPRRVRRPLSHPGRDQDVNGEFPAMSSSQGWSSPATLQHMTRPFPSQSQGHAVNDGFRDTFHDSARPFGSQSHSEVMADGNSHGLSQTEDVIPNSQPVRTSHQRFIPSFTSKRFKNMQTPVQTPRTNIPSISAQAGSASAVPVRPHPRQMVNDTPHTLNIPGAITPGGSMHGTHKLRPIEEIPENYRSVFHFPYFNIVQSKVLDDVLYSDRPVVVCAPTGAGKTVLFELAIVRLLIALGDAAFNSKIVYMAPIKVLCSQRCEEWKGKFEPLGLKCQELTGDTEVDDYFLLQTVNIVCTTPEKWDSMTRKWRDNKSLVQLVRLFLIDEVHSLNDESRGATVEAVVSRMKTVQAAVARDKDKESDDIDSNPTNSILRFMAVSATIPNIEDVAEWLGNDGRPALHHMMDDSHRPVKLRKVVLGFSCQQNQSEFRFDLSLNYKLSGVIQTYSDQKPTLVFCATRKGCQQAAGILVKEARFILNAQHKQRLQKCANMLRESKLRDLVIHGVGFHHAGLDLQDRKAIEEVFVKGDLPVLMATSTLAMGVNLPAHLVIIKSTQHYVASTYAEYSETQILQMIGRAGRPQFDTTATAVIMTKNSTKRKYEMLLEGKEKIESSLHNHLIEHLNAEIVLHTINDISIAIEWLKSTFLFVRIKKNSSHYGIQVGLSEEQLIKRLQDMCIKDLNLLAQYRLIHMDGETMDLKPTETGRLMARYCIAFNTMQRFSKITGTETLEEMISMLAECKEFGDIQLRVNERRTLNTLNKDKNRVTIRYPMNGKIKTTPMKVNCLIQATLGCLPVQDFPLSQDCVKIFRVGQRTTRCLMEFLQQRANFKAFLNATIIAKCFRARLWENSKFVARQVDKIGPALAMALVNAGIVSFHKMEETNARQLELIVNRHPPFGNQIQDAVIHLPKYDVSIEQVNKYQAMNAEILVTVSVMNQDALSEKQTAKSNHACMLVIGDTDNCIVSKQRIMDSQILKCGPWTRRIEVKRAAKGEELSVNLISQDYVGLDVQSTYTPFYSGPKHLRASNGEMATSSRRQQSDTMHKSLRFESPINNALSSPDDVSEYFTGRKPCSHRCINKDTCAHECCKFGVIIKTPSMPKGEGTSKKRALGQLQLESTMAGRGHQDILGGKNAAGKLDGYISQLHAKTHSMPSTPALKRLKANQESKGELNLQKFAYTPKDTLLRTPSSSAFGPSSTPRVPATPSGKGWEHLDLYHQQRHQQQFQEDDNWNNEDFQVSERTPVGNTEEESSNTDNMLPSFDVDWNDIMQNEDDAQHVSPNQHRPLYGNANHQQVSNVPRRQGKVFAWNSPPRANTSRTQKNPMPSNFARGNNDDIDNSSAKDNQSSYKTDFTSARHVMLNQPLGRTNQSVSQTPPGTHLQEQMAYPYHQSNQPAPPPPHQRWIVPRTPKESPEILSIHSSPAMSLQSPPVIVLSDDGGDAGSIHSGAGYSAVSSMSSPDDMMMKCVEAEEARYSQEQLSPVIIPSRCDAPVIHESTHHHQPIPRKVSANKSFFTMDSNRQVCRGNKSKMTESDDVRQTFDSIFQGIF